jgi:4-diphosphocytidyl-2-C-methyl-D-erythritol kinase
MSGSGATCFALFESTEAAAEAQSETEATHKGWWTAQGALR